MYVLDPLITDPKECAARSSHGRTEEDVAAAAAALQPPPPAYPLLDCSRMLPPRLGGRLGASGDIAEVEMEAETGGGGGGRAAKKEVDPLTEVVAKSRSVVSVCGGVGEREGRWGRVEGGR